MRRAQKLEAGVANQHHGVQLGGAVVVVERLEPGREPTLGQSHLEQVDARERRRVAVDDFDLLERFFVRDENAFHRPVGRHGNAVEDVVKIVEQHLCDADQTGGKLTSAQAFGQAARRQKLGFSLETIS
jgi:hypothetical protein